MYQDVLGIVGGFGSCGTLRFYTRFLEAFATGKDSDYPRVMMENDFPMPSRARAMLFNEKYDEVLDRIVASIERLHSCGATHIVLVCGTAHCFLADIYAKYPETKSMGILDITDLTARYLQGRAENVLVMASEGCIEKHVYDNKLVRYGLKSVQPAETDYPALRYFIDTVKENRIDSETLTRFCSFIERFGTKDILLGCTEFPVLVDALEKETSIGDAYAFFDPLEITIQHLKNVLH